MFKHTVLGVLTLAFLDPGAADPPPRTDKKAYIPGLFSTDDYPMEAIARREQGTVAVTLEIAPSGKVSRCTVTQSATPVLDARTCAVITERASYPPVLDGNGRPIATRDAARVRWVLPDASPEKFADRWFEINATVQPDGTTRCTVSGRSGTQAMDQQSCDRLVQANIPYRPSTVVAPYRMTIREERLVGDAIARLPKGQGPARVIVRTAIDPDGYVSSCTLVPEPAPEVDSEPFYNCLLNGRYEALPQSEPNRGDRVLTITWMRTFSALAGTDR